MKRAQKIIVELQCDTADETKAVELARRVYASTPGCSAVDENGVRRRIEPEVWVPEISSAILELVERNPLLDQAAVEVIGLSWGVADEPVGS